MSSKLFRRTLIILSVLWLIAFSWNLYADSDSKSLGGAESVVKKLYRDYAWEVLFKDTVFAELSNESTTNLEQYFSAELAELIVKDRKCVEQTNDICKLDFDFIYATQDRSAIHELRVEPTNSDFIIKVSFGNAYEAPRTQLIFAMKQTTKGWRIDNIDYGNGKGTLRTILTGAEKK